MRAARGGLVVTLLGALAVSSAGAATDDLTLPPPTYPHVARLLDTGDHAAALDTLTAAVQDGPGQPLEALVLRATLLAHEGRAPDAEAVWRRVIGRAVWMRTYSRRALVTSLAGRGEPALAAPILSELNRSDATRHLDLTLLVADAHRAQGEVDRAAALYREALGRRTHGALADRARLGLAAAQEAAGNLSAAIATLRDAQLEHRTGPGYADALAAERRLSQRLPRAPFTPTQYQLMTRRLRSYARYGEAAALIDEWRTVQPDAAERLDVEMIGVLYDSRSNAEAVARCAAFAARYPSSPLLPDVRLTEFRLAVRMGDTATARTLGLHLWEGRVPGATAQQRFNAGELLAAYLVAVGDVEGGLDLYRGLFRRATSADGQRTMLWKAGVAALRAGQNARALTNLRALNQRRPTGDLQPAGQYWQAIADTRAGRTNEAERAFRALVDTRPYHYYGLRARARLEELRGDDGVPAPPLRQFPAVSLGSSAPTRAEFKAAMVLARAGLVRDAAWYLRRLLERQGRNRGLALLATRASAEAGDYAAVARLLATHFGSFLQQPAAGLPGDFYALVYPRPFVDAVTSAAGGRDLDPAFMFSLMRQESRFDPAARSLAGALGLFQIMPYTATELGPRSGLDDLSGADFENETVLLQPPVNAAIAATLAGDLFALFGGALAPVIASYNAGEERVAIWWASARGLPEDLFVDTIPYSETRRFVREVLANVAGYQRVYGGTGPAR
ncbi:MAG: transglycosylase SLT domain-containing protein [Acidobacteria bacterium]|nr:transglycosylase SLT domain-containing protein [Acidobacteriota bacterium]